MYKILCINKKKILLFNLFLLLCVLIIFLVSPLQDGTASESVIPISSLDYAGYVDIYCKTTSSDIPALKLYLNNDKGYFFLPSCTKLTDFSFLFNEDEYLITINNIPVHTQDSLMAYSLDKEYHMCITNQRNESDPIDYALKIGRAHV